MIRYSIYYLLKTLVNQISTMYLVSFLEAMENAKTTFVIRAVHRGAFCQFPFQWIYYCHSSKSAAGNALAWVQPVHEPADLWDITLCTR